MAMNRAIAIGEVEGSERALAAIDDLQGLERYHLFHATRADLLYRLGRDEEAAEAYARAAGQAPDGQVRAHLVSKAAAAGSRRPSWSRPPPLQFRKWPTSARSSA